MHHLRVLSRSPTLLYSNNFGPRFRIVWRLSTRQVHCTSYPPEPLKLPDGYHSLLPLVHSTSNLVLSHSQDGCLAHTRTADGASTKEERVVPFRVSISDRYATGYLRPEVAQALIKDTKCGPNGEPWEIEYSAGQPGVVESVSFAKHVNQGGKLARTMHIERLVHRWKDNGLFHDILRGWSDEAYPVYHHLPLNNAKGSMDPVAFAIERAALPLFGFANFGCLLTGYTHDPKTGKVKLWIPRRSLTKRTWPGMLDVTVGGGMGLGDSAMTTILRECAEEAMLDRDYIQKHIRPVGVLPFPNRSPAGWILPGTYYLFDLQLPHDGSIAPHTNEADGEVENFELMELEVVLQNLLSGKFKASSALAVVDFLIRHGYLTEKTDSNYTAVCSQLRRDVGLPLPWQN